MTEIDLLDELDPPCPRGCGRTMDDCHEAEDGDECAGSELVQRLQRELANAISDAARLTGDRIALTTITGEMREALGVDQGGPWEMCERLIAEVRQLREQVAKTSERRYTRAEVLAAVDFVGDADWRDWDLKDFATGVANELSKLDAASRSSQGEGGDH